MAMPNGDLPKLPNCGWASYWVELTLVDDSQADWREDWGTANTWKFPLAPASD